MRTVSIADSNWIDGDGSPVIWALAKLRKAFAAAGWNEVRSVDAQIYLHVETGPGPQAADWSRTGGRALSSSPDSFVIAELQGCNRRELLAWGSDPRGTVYALTELADRLEHCLAGEDPFSFPEPLVLTPTASLRSISRIFSSEVEDKAWFYDREGWRQYLDMLVSNRFNRIALTFGMPYNYPYTNGFLTDVYLHFTYPFLVAPPGYDVRVRELSDAERADNLAALQFIAREAARRGLEFQIGLWTHGYDFSDTPQANYTVEGVTPQNHAFYCRDALYEILQAVPEIRGVTLRVHVEGGIAEGSYDFWQQIFAGMARTGRPIEVDLHAKGVDHRLIALARKSGLPVNLSPKYLAEHLGLPYHQSAIREYETRQDQEVESRMGNSEGSRRFLRYSYGDLLTENRGYSVSFRIWPGTQRILLWGNPDHAGAYGQMATFCGATGVELCEPLSYKGRMGSGVPGGRHNYVRSELIQKYDWMKYRIQYRIWGQRTHDASAPAAGWMRFLQSACGTAAADCAQALSSASPILPLVTLAFGPSASNHTYWPEMYDPLSLVYSPGRRPYGFDFTQPGRFGTAPTFDPQLFMNPAEFARDCLSPEHSRRYTPLDVADWLQAMASTSKAAVTAARAGADNHRAETVRILVDAAMLASIGQFFAHKFRAACAWELFMLTGSRPLLEQAQQHYQNAAQAWRDCISESDDIYQNELSYGRPAWLRGNWKSRLSTILRDIGDLEAWGHEDGPKVTPDPERDMRAQQGLANWRPVRHDTVEPIAPRHFNAGADLPIAFSHANTRLEQPLLHYRHVNQAQPWQAIAMTHHDGAYRARIPASYTDTAFPLQYYFSWMDDTTPVLAPGLTGALDNQPYWILRQELGTALA